MKLNSVRRLTFCAMAMAMMSLCGVSVAKSPSYTVQQVHPELAEVAGMALNDKAKVAAIIKNKKGQDVGAVCSAAACSKASALPGAPQGSLAGVYAIDRRGHAVGSSPTGQTWSHAILFDGIQTWDLGAFDEDSCGGCSLYSFGYGMNDKGQVVGSSLTGDGDVRAFVWKDGVMTKLPTLGGRYSEAFAINERGVAVGMAELDDVSHISHAVLYRKGRALDLGVLGLGASSRANDINNLDVVVGQSFTDGPRGTVPFVYSEGVLKQLPMPAGALDGIAWRINDAGWIVWSYLKSGESLRRGWVFNGQEAYDLNDLIPAADREQWRIVRASGINALGQILVNANKLADQTFTDYALILTPVAQVD